MRTTVLLALLATTSSAQQVIDVAPLQPPDLSSPYASPRDAARHRLAHTLALNDGKAQVRGFADALIKDPQYSLAAFNLGIAFAQAGKWEDAVSALDEATKLDASLATEIKAQQERLRLLATLDKSPEGRRRRRYDEALLPILDRLPKLPPAQKLYTLAELGRIDARRWEAPALFAAIATNYEVAAKFLTIAEANATEPGIKLQLAKARGAAEREVKYTTAKLAADVAFDSGDHAKAAELYESAWVSIPARVSDGLSAAAEYLLQDDTAKAAALLTKINHPRAAAMLSHLQAVEPAAKQVPSAPSADPGALDPPSLAPMLPPIDRTNLEVLARPMPQLRPDPEPPVLLSAFLAEPSAVSDPPQLPEPATTAEPTWREVQAAVGQRLVPQMQTTSPVITETVELAQGPRAKAILISSDPPAAQVFVDDNASMSCRTPCRLTLQTGAHKLRLSREGYKDDGRAVTIKQTNDEVVVPMEVLRGAITIELPAGGTLAINGKPVELAATPAQLLLLPGLYRFVATLGSIQKEQTINIKPDAKLKLAFAP